MEERWFVAVRAGSPCLRVAVWENGRSRPLTEPPGLGASGVPWETGQVSPGAEQLGLAMLYEVSKDWWLSNRFHKVFAFDTLAKLPRDGWELPCLSVRRWLDQEAAEDVRLTGEQEGE